MQILSARHVKTEESLRLGVVSGWYSTKVKRHLRHRTARHTQEDCLSKIAELQSGAGSRKEVLIAGRSNRGVLYVAHPR